MTSSWSAAETTLGVKRLQSTRAASPPSVTVTGEVAERPAPTVALTTTSPAAVAVNVPVTSMSPTDASPPGMPSTAHTISPPAAPETSVANWTVAPTGMRQSMGSSEIEPGRNPSSIRNLIGRVRPSLRAMYSPVFTFLSSLPLLTRSRSANPRSWVST